MRNYSLDVLRGLSILLVLIHHFNIPYKLHDTILDFSIFGESFLTLIARNGNYGVTMFFVISGFLITQNTLARYGSIQNINIKDFYIRRVARIFPCLILLVCIVSLLGLLGWQPFLNQTPNNIEVSYTTTVLSVFSFWMNLLIIQYGWVNYALGVLWSLSVEEVFYIAFPILCLLLKRVSLFVIFLIAIIIYAPYFRSLHFGHENGAYLYHYFSSFDGIALGCLTAIIATRISITAIKVPYIIPIISLLMCCMYFYAPIKEVSTWGISIFAVLTSILIFCFAQQPKRTLPQSITSKFFVWIGQRSYEMYLFHLIVLGIIKVFYLPKQTMVSEKIGLILFYFLAVFALSWLIEKYYSTPLNNKIRNLYLKRK